LSGIVIDASVAGSYSALIDDAHALYAPEIIDLEFANLVRKSVIRRGRDAHDADDEIAAWAINDVLRFPHAPRLEAVWAMRHNITPYDASYVALAVELDVPLVTADRRLAAAAERYCEVIVVE
jgi:predicted nucleic acid-binding protein